MIYKLGWVVATCVLNIPKPAQQLCCALFPRHIHSSSLIIITHLWSPHVCCSSTYDSYIFVLDTIKNQTCLCPFGGFIKQGYPQSSSISSWDFPWNKPAFGGSPIYGKPHLPRSSSKTTAARHSYGAFPAWHSSCCQQGQLPAGCGCWIEVVPWSIEN